MTLGEKLYSLRKKNGLSQEQLAEILNVSRQSISKWEGNVTYPEPDKLIALSDYFQVSLDYLMKADIADEGETEKDHGEHLAPKQSSLLSGLTICLAAVISLIFFGLLVLLFPKAAEPIGASSLITLNGVALVVLFFLGLLVIGVALVIRIIRRNLKRRTRE